MVKVLALALVYLVAGLLGLSLDPVGGFATVVWPPAGVALAALLLFGRSLWPGVALGAFLVNASTGAPIAVALAMAGGNTLEAVVCALILRRLAGFDVWLSKLRDVVALAAAAAVSTVIAATIGVAALRTGAVILASDAMPAWLAWWIGDTVGIIALTPLILVWTARPLPRLPRVAAIEAALVGASLIALSLLVFATPHASNGSPFWQAYILSPLLVWAALRFYQLGAVTAIILVSGIAIWGTARGLGPFTGGQLHERLEELQMFMAVTALTFLVLGVVSAERRAAETQLLKAKEDAEAASRAKSRFLAVTSHELRTPLTGILGYADLLATGVSGPLSESQHAQVGRIKAAAWHLVGIIDDILTFSRAEAGRESVEPEAVDAVSLTRAAVALVEPAASTKQLAVKLYSAHERLPMFTDSRKVKQILVNILANAVKFTEVGSVDVTLERDDYWVEFHVRDDGPGIPPEQLARIFEPFTQVDESSTRLQGGNGLGLSVARALAELLGGRITVQTEPGQGSTFTLRIPANVAVRASVMMSSRPRIQR